MIVGVDEVGRGPWAGPLVVGAVALNGAVIEGLTDSKKLTAKKRELLSTHILASNASVGLGWVHAKELDEIGLSNSLIEATKRALNQISTPYHEIIIDGTINFLKDTNKGRFVTTMKKADLLIPSVSAASIVAKVARDEYMTAQSIVYPEYGFESHVGYGTALHRATIEKHGLCPLHRRSFGPLRSIEREIDTRPPTRSTTAIGNAGEDAACQYLESNGYDIIDRNWKTKFCEIDIVASKSDTIYFVEVKHRKNNEHGDGLDAITKLKQQKMTFAARMYVQFNTLNTPMRLAVISTTGDPATVLRYLELE